MKYVLNTKFGSFGLSREACRYLKTNYPERIKLKDVSVFYSLHRNAPELVECVEKLGDKANGMYSRLAVVEVPDNVECTIEEYDGVEWLAEKHRIWDRDGERLSTDR